MEKVEYFDNTHTEFIEYQKRLQAEARRKRAVKSHEEERRDKEAELEKRRALKELEELQIRRRAQIEYMEEGAAGGEDQGTKCGACGMFGHSKNSKKCPLYWQTQQQRREEEQSQYNRDVQRRGLVLKFQAHAVKETENKLVIGGEKLRRIKRKQEEEASRERKRARASRGAAGRRAGNPLVTLNNELKKVADELRRAQEYEPFVLPVAKYIPSYTSHIARTMDLHTMGLNCDKQAYSRAAAFEADLDLIASNCHDFNTKHNVPEPAPRADRARPRRAWQGARRRAPRGHRGHRGAALARRSRAAARAPPKAAAHQPLLARRGLRLPRRTPQQQRRRQLLLRL